MFGFLKCNSQERQLREHIKHLIRESEALIRNSRVGGQTFSPVVEIQVIDFESLKATAERAKEYLGENLPREPNNDYDWFDF